MSVASCAAVLLAAGGSRRMGRPKALLEVGGETLLAWAARAASGAGLSPVIAVVGSRGCAVRTEADRLGICTVENRRWREGVASSIRAGVRAACLRQRDLPACAILAVDQPFVDQAALARLRAVFADGGRLAAACRYENALGIPAIFAAPLFGELLRLSGDCGARRLLASDPGRVAALDAPAAAFDCDTPADYARLVKAWPAQKGFSISRMSQEWRSTRE
jgi:molybdenum cofactor cytidylyltransferase